MPSTLCSRRKCTNNWSIILKLVNLVLCSKNYHKIWISMPYQLLLPVNLHGLITALLKIKLMVNISDHVWVMNSLSNGWKILMLLIPPKKPYRFNLMRSRLPHYNLMLCNGVIKAGPTKWSENSSEDLTQAKYS